MPKPVMPTVPGRPLLRVALLFLLAALFIAAQAAPATPRGLRFEHIGVEQGLAQESVLTILQDRQGFMWFGTQAGLSRFDGYRSIIFKHDPTDPGSLVDNYVISGFEDPKGRLWFGTKGGLVRYDTAQQKFVRYPVPDLAARGNRSVFAIAPDGDTGLWLATAEGLQRLDTVTGAFRSYRHDPAKPGSIDDNRVAALALDNNGVLWVGTASGVNRLRDDGQFDRYPVRDEGNSPGVLSLAAGDGQTLWVGTGNGLEKWSSTAAEPQRRKLGIEEGMPTVRVLALLRDKAGNVFAGTDIDGVKWLNPMTGRFHSYRSDKLDRKSISDNQIASLFVDRTGTLWCGSWYGGANYADLSSGGFMIALHSDLDPDSIASSKVRVIKGDPGGKLWLGTTGGGMSWFDPVTRKAENIRKIPGDPESLPSDSVTAIEPGGSSVWVGTISGVASMDVATRRFRHLRLGPDPLSNYIQTFLTDREGTLWIASRGGLHRMHPDGRTVTTYRHEQDKPDSLGDSYLYSLLEDSKGNFWIGTDSGLDLFDRKRGTFTHYRHDPGNPASLRHSRVAFMHEDSKGNIWLGTAGGLNRMVKDGEGQIAFKFYPLSAAKAADPVGAILEDSKGRLWVSTTTGISRLNPETGEFKAYTSKDGLIDGSYFVGSGYKSKDGSLHFGGLNGMTSFRAEEIVDNPHVPPVVITEFLVFNQPVIAGPVHDAKAVTLDHGAAVISLEFAALHFADPRRNRYAYQLEGFDKTWVETAADKRFATYTNLDPGTYTFRVKASNKDGVWNEEGAKLVLTITPPFWQATWFRVLAVLLLASLTYGLMRLRVRSLVEQKLQLEQQVKVRTLELLQQKENAERQKESVEVAHRNISLLSEIGRKLTAKLDSEAIMMMLYGQVRDLMDASVFGIGVYRPERGAIEIPFSIEEGKRYEPYTRSMSEPNQLAVWCINNQKEVFINDLASEYGNYISDLELTTSPDSMGTLADGTLPVEPKSMMYVPIIVNGAVRGMVSVHSYRENAYQRMHLDMLRTLASYVGVAFENADAYEQLKDTQAQLVAQEKLAALGSLVAGVAHELNTPIGNSLLMASTLQEKTVDIGKAFDAGAIKKSDLAGFIGAAREAAGLIMRSLMAAAELVNSFKQVAVDQASAHRRPFDLDVATNEITATMMNQVRKAGHVMETDIPPGIKLNSYPGPFGQVLINFINNAMLHAFEAPGGVMRVKAHVHEPGRVLIEFSDNGRGIAREHLPRIFDPFFTTKMGQGGSGLGLNIAYNIVTSLLEGTIKVDSVVGEGTCFTIDIPLVTENPEH